MISILKIAGVSAVMAAGLVAAMDGRGAESAPGSTKMFQDRIVADAPADKAAPAASIRLADASGVTYGPEIARTAKSDAAKASPHCQGQTWPAVTADCIAASGGADRPRNVRVISLETRQGANVSLIVKASR